MTRLHVVAALCVGLTALLLCLKHMRLDVDLFIGHLKVSSSPSWAHRQALLEGVRQTDALVATLRNQSQGTACSGDDGERGLLFSADSHQQLLNVLVSVTYLRKVLGSTLPVEVIHFRPPAQHAADLLRAPHLRPLTLIDGAKVPLPPGRYRPASIAPYGLKVYALAYVTRFRHVLYVDADNVPLTDPAALFEAAEYKTHGALFWPDVFRTTPWTRPDIYTALGMQPPWEGSEEYKESETGQLLLDRCRHRDVLEYAWLLNAHAEYTYRMMNGDKDTFLIAFHLAGKHNDFRRVDVWSGAILSRRIDRRDRFDFMGQMQFTPEGRFGFWHQQKFFDHCFPDPRRCLADWLTVPLSAARARAIWHQRKVWSAITNAVDTDAYRRDCASGSTLAGGVHQLMRGCGWKQQQDSLPVPALPLFSGAVEAGDAARLAATVHVFELVLAQVNSERALMPPG